MRRLTRFASTLYPRWWRERYGDEFGALIEDARPGFGGVVDITKGALAMQISTPISAKRIWLAGTLLGLVVGGAASLWMSPTYRSVAVLQFKDTRDASNQNILNEVSKAANVTLSRGSLWTLIGDFKLYPDERNRMPAEEVFEIMRQDITLRPVRALAQGSAQSAFEISFAYPNRFTASRVVAEIVRQLTVSTGLVVLDPASLPVGPLTPNRSVLISAGLGFGFAAGGFIGVVIYIRRLQKRVKELEAK